jgi:hypothetical protein
MRARRWTRADRRATTASTDYLRRRSPHADDRGSASTHRLPSHRPSARQRQVSLDAPRAATTEPRARTHFHDLHDAHGRHLPPALLGARLKHLDRDGCRDPSTPQLSRKPGRLRPRPGMRSYEGRRGRHRTAGASLGFANLETRRVVGAPAVIADRLEFCFGVNSGTASGADGAARRRLPIT